MFFLLQLSFFRHWDKFDYNKKKRFWSRTKAWLFVFCCNQASFGAERNFTTTKKKKVELELDSKIGAKLKLYSIFLLLLSFFSRWNKLKRSSRSRARTSLQVFFKNILKFNSRFLKWSRVRIWFLKWSWVRMLNLLMFTFVGHILQRYFHHKDYGNTSSIACIGINFGLHNFKFLS